VTLAELLGEIADLCPAGSEWHNDPKRQLAWIRATLDTRAKIAGERNRLQSRLTIVEMAARDLIDYRLRAGALGFQLEKADDYINKLESVIEGTAQ